MSAKTNTFNLQPTNQYSGPKFNEYCISERQYLSSNRDRKACTSCPLRFLRQAGFEEQVRRVGQGQNLSLTDRCVLI